MTLPYGLFMAEAENRFPETRKASLEGAIADFIALKRKGLDPNNYINEVLAKHNLKECQLSAAEISKINDTVNRCY